MCSTSYLFYGTLPCFRTYWTFGKECNQNIDKSIRDAARSLDLCPRSVDAAAATAPAASTASLGRWLEKLLVV